MMNNEIYKCEFCGQDFKSKCNLGTHKKNAKYCLELQGKQNSDKYTCDFCCKTFTSFHNLQIHHNSCRNRQKHDYDEKCEQIKKFYEEKLSEKDRHIQEIKLYSEKLFQEKAELKEQIADLQNKLYELASRPQVVNSNSNNTTNNKVMNLQMITPEHLNSQAQYLTMDHIKRGALGYGEYFLEYPLKDRVVCTDFSRRKLKYKNENGEIVTDPELTNLSESLFKSIKERNKELAMQYTKEITERFANKNDPAEISYFMELAGKFSEQDIAIGKMLDGDKNEMFHDIIRHICSKTIEQK